MNEKRIFQDPFYLQHIKPTGNKLLIANWIVANWRRTKRNATGFTVIQMHGEPAVVVFREKGKRLHEQPDMVEGVKIYYR